MRFARRRSDHAPILLLSGPRSGSTLLQRALNTSPTVAIAGEHFGVLTELRVAARRLEAHDDQLLAGKAETPLITSTPPWTGALHPQAGPVDAAAFRSAVRSMLIELLAVPLPKNTRWGFKEIRYDADDLAFWRELFPRTRTILLTRRPAAQISSYIRAPWRDLRTSAGAPDWDAVGDHARSGVDAWRRMHESFIAIAEQDRHDVRALTYEAVTGPGGVALLDELFVWLDTTAPDPATLRDVLATKALSSDGNASWTPAERDRLDEVIAGAIAADDRLPAVTEWYYGSDDDPGSA